MESAQFTREIRKIVLTQARRANVGHIGSALSIVDILAALYTGAMRLANVADPERDRLILSKGHAALALYATLFMKGWISEAVLNTHCGDGSRLGVHPERGIAGVDFGTGSLGQGLSVGVGAALAARLQLSPRRVFVLLSDAECNEGAIWEAAMFAAHHHLSNLIAIIDVNGQQAMGRTRDILDLAPLADRWRAFGWDVDEVDGNDTGSMQRAFDAMDTTMGQPHVIVARTIFGKGVSFMESQIKWHYLPLTDAEFEQALDEVAVAT
jgi:transketolase